MKYEIYIFEEVKTASFYKKAIEEYEKTAEPLLQNILPFHKKTKRMGETSGRV